MYQKIFVKFFLVLTLIFKTITATSISIKNLSIYFFFIPVTYIALNIMLMTTIFKQSKEYLKCLLSISIVIDQIYSLLNIVIIPSTPLWTIRTGSGYALAYYTAAYIFIRTKTVLWTITCFSIAFFINMIIKFWDKMSEENVNFISQFACFLGLMIIGNLLLKEKV